MPKADGQVVTLPYPARLRQLDGQMRQRSQGHADRQALDPYQRRQEDGGGDDRQVVDQRREAGTAKRW